MTKRQYNFRQTIKEQKAFISREKAILKDARDKICQSVSVTKLPNLTKVSHVPKVAPLAADWTAEMSYQTPTQTKRLIKPEADCFDQGNRHVANLQKYKQHLRSKFFFHYSYDFNKNNSQI